MFASNSRPIKNYEWVMNDLKQQIQEGNHAAGDKLPSVVDLAAQYNVGRSTIREALSALKAMGMLDIRQGGGTFVKSMMAEPQHPAYLDPEQWKDRTETLRNFLDVRRVVETGCAELAAVNRTEEDLQALRHILTEMRDNLHDEAFGEQADVRFHQQIAKSTHNPILIDLIDSLSQSLHENMKDTRALWFYAERSEAERLLQEHHSIYEAIAEGNGPTASARMNDHITKVEQVLQENQS